MPIFGRLTLDLVLKLTNSNSESVDSSTYLVILDQLLISNMFDIYLMIQSTNRSWQKVGCQFWSADRKLAEWVWALKIDYCDTLPFCSAFLRLGYLFRFKIRLKPIFHQNAKSFALGTFASPNAKDSTFALPDARNTNMLVSFALGDANFLRWPCTFHFFGVYFIGVG